MSLNYYLLVFLVPFIVSSASIPLGCYVGNPNGNDPAAMANFEAHFKNFSRAMGETPTHMNTFVDFSQDWSLWVKNAQWSAWSWSLSSLSKNLIPVVGIPMMPGSMYDHCEEALNEVIAGKYDDVFKGIVQAYKDQGYTHIHARIGWEANGNWYAWNWNGKNSTGGSIVPQWIAAFRRIATNLRSVSGMQVTINWNPCTANWSPFDITLAYPGDSVVDIIALDIYSTVWPGSLYDWAKDNGTVDANVEEFVKSAVNREHVWDYPAANQWDKQSLGGWGMVMHLRFAKEHNKPIALCETGVGVNPSNPQNGIPDDGDFPKYLRARIDASGVQTAYINIWDVNLGDGHWQFSDGSKPQAAMAWKTAFGA